MYSRVWSWYMSFPIRYGKENELEIKKRSSINCKSDEYISKIIGFEKLIILLI